MEEDGKGDADAQEGEKRRVHFGSLEADAARSRHEDRDREIDQDEDMGNDNNNDQASQLRRAQASGNVNVSTEASETLELSASALQEQEKRALALLEIETQRKARALVVPTSDAQVKAQLRELGHPICLFGERPADRRDRLRKELALLEVDASERDEIQARLDRASAIAAKRARTSESHDDDQPQDQTDATREIVAATTEAETRNETFYSKANFELVEARRQLCTFSWERARARLAKERAETGSQEALLGVDDAILSFEDKVKQFEVEASQVGDRRPLTCCAIARGHARMVTGSARGWARVWDRETFEHTWTMADHSDRIVDVAINEANSGPQADEAFFVATASADCTTKLWRVPIHKNVSAGETDVDMNDAPGGKSGGGVSSTDFADDAEATAAQAAADQEELAKSLKPVGTLDGHAQRLSRVAWHPMGTLVGTSSFDHTWRLWDVESQRAILVQDGHEAPVYAFAFHPDGSLALSGDLKGVARLWDLRSGKAIHALMGHAGQILGADFSVNGYHVATGSSDNTARIWDLRKKTSLHTLPGHMSIVRDVRFDPVHGAVLATASYDQVCRLWDAPEGILLADLRAHDKMVTGVAWSPLGDALLTCSYDRTWKVFAPSRFMGI
ncbi:Guanine nucleotide-binding protein subunit beta [Hondaea fermentalgiana]|uniref:Guanine nucleotide-binding protein subunit beta n=1 Tax=Hondaea fermentalgiana TaxID=2315210 RepID=A0A2R5GTH8_9STRA|nr:Guanine nucleotide-binding protein subunit beta [Hondaea fermentalgiana]|eukprot:GBG33629.1 Guanine nucleotide-binding protein subunit beta [Hondaea fermentalgiana]